MKPVLGALSVALLSTSLTGCGYIFGDTGYFRDRGGDYQLARVEPRMTIPDGIEAKPIGDLLPVPGEVRQGTGGKFEVPRPRSLAVAGQGGDFSVHQSGNARWLVAQRPPSEVYSGVRQFLEDYEVPVEREAVGLGEIETGWIVFGQQTGVALTRRLAPALATARRIEGQEHRFRLRVEPGVQGASSEIHALHMARSAGGTQDSWPSRSENINLEHALLAELENYLSQGGNIDGASLVDARAPRSDRATLGQDGAGNPILSIQGDFNRAWANVGSALQRAEVEVADLNRSAGVYYVDLDGVTAARAEKRGFFGRMFGRGRTATQEDEQRVQIRLTQLTGEVQVTVERTIQTATDAGIARDLLTRIRDNL